MSFCTYCGAKVADDALFCPNCGASTSKGGASDASYTGGYFHAAPKRDYGESVGLAILSFIIPIVGVILWAVWKDSEPGKANSALKGLWAYLCCNIPIVGVIMFFVWRYTKPDFAKVGLVAGIISFALSFLFGILWSGMILPAIYDGMYSTVAAFAPVLF